MDLLSPTIHRHRNLPLFYGFFGFQNQAASHSWSCFLTMTRHGRCSWAANINFKSQFGKEARCVTRSDRHFFLLPSSGYNGFLNHREEWKLSIWSSVSSMERKATEKQLQLWRAQKSGAGEYLWRSDCRVKNLMYDFLWPKESTASWRF